MWAGGVPGVLHMPITQSHDNRLYARHGSLGCGSVCSMFQIQILKMPILAIFGQFFKYSGNGQEWVGEKSYVVKVALKLTGMYQLQGVSGYVSTTHIEKVQILGFSILTPLKIPNPETGSLWEIIGYVGWRGARGIACANH